MSRKEGKMNIEELINEKRNKANDDRDHFR